MAFDLTRRSALAAVAAPFIISPFAHAADSPPDGFVSVRDFGAKGDGVSDDTDALTRAHASANPIYYPRTDAFYRISHVLPLSASTKANGATIQIVGDGKGSTTIFRVGVNPSGRLISISGFILDGGYKGGTNGEWSHGIELGGTNNVTIEGNTIRNPYGDCVYVGSENASIASRNIRIQDNKLLNPRRCNVAVVCGEGVVIQRNTCVKITDYVTGIDLEPNVNGFDYVRGVSITGNNFSSVKFISAGVNNGIDNTGLSVSGNTGRALQFFHGWANARLHQVTLVRNRFSSTGPDGSMFILDGVKGGVVSGNVDRTPCAAGYRSTNIQDCDLTLKGNRFCA